jgi:hypothetical protein
MATPRPERDHTVLAFPLLKIGLQGVTAALIIRIVPTHRPLANRSKRQPLSALQ